MNTIILKSHFPFSAANETKMVWQNKKEMNKSSYELNMYKQKREYPIRTRLNEKEISLITEGQIVLSTRVNRILEITAFYPIEVYEMEQHLFRTLKGIFSFFLPIFSGFKIAFNLLWRITCMDQHPIKRFIRSVKSLRI